MNTIQFFQFKWVILITTVHLHFDWSPAYFSPLEALEQPDSNPVFLLCGCSNTAHNVKYMKFTFVLIRITWYGNKLKHWTTTPKHYHDTHSAGTMCWWQYNSSCQIQLKCSVKSLITSHALLHFVSNSLGAWNILIMVWRVIIFAAVLAWELSLLNKNWGKKKEKQT